MQQEEYLVNKLDPNIGSIFAAYESVSRDNPNL
jgi:hypothetical protein